MVPPAQAHRRLAQGLDQDGKVEELAHRTAERLTVNAVTAWWLSAMTLLGRETPELPADVTFSDVEIGGDFATDGEPPASAPEF